PFAPHAVLGTPPLQDWLIRYRTEHFSSLLQLSRLGLFGGAALFRRLGRLADCLRRGRRYSHRLGVDHRRLLAGTDGAGAQQRAQRIQTTAATLVVTSRIGDA